MLNHNYIGTEHLLLGLIHEGEGVAAKSLEALGISLDAVREQVQEIIGTGQTAPSGHIPFTPRAKKVLELSLREALLKKQPNPVLEARALPVVDLEDLPADGFLLVLDQVTDPHNVGAILRTAAAFGVTGIVTTERHSPAHTGVLAKAASGGLEHVPIASVVNLARALETLGKMGYLRVGLDSDGPESLEDTVLSNPLALVLGAEGKGLRRLTRENCDVLARIDLPGAVRSLNVSNACAVALTITRLKLGKA